jgi:hypothetical protein
MRRGPPRLGVALGRALAERRAPREPGARLVQAPAHRRGRATDERALGGGHRRPALAQLRQAGVGGVQLAGRGNRGAVGQRLLSGRDVQRDVGEQLEMSVHRPRKRKAGAGREDL